jgi:multisubunit Na+/H+ antiporter MnhG subunit
MRRPDNSLIIFHAACTGFVVGVAALVIGVFLAIPNFEHRGPPPLIGIELACIAPFLIGPAASLVVVAMSDRRRGRASQPSW